MGALLEGGSGETQESKGVATVREPAVQTAPCIPTNVRERPKLDPLGVRTAERNWIKDREIAA